MTHDGVPYTELLKWSNGNEKVCRSIIKNQLIPGNYRENKQLYFPVHEFNKFINSHEIIDTGDKVRIKPSGTLSSTELSERWKVTSIITFFRIKKMPSQMKFLGVLHVSIEDILDFECNLPKLQDPFEDGIEYIHSSTLKQWLRTQGVNDPKQKMARITKENVIPGAVKKRTGRNNAYNWFYPKEAYQNFIKEHEVYCVISASGTETHMRNVKPKNSLSINELAALWGISYKTVHQYVWEGRLKGIIVFMGVKYVPLKIVKTYEDRKTVNEKKEPLSKNELIDNLVHSIDKKTPQDYTNTNKYLFINFCKDVFRISKASLQNLHSKSLSYICAYDFLITIRKEITQISDEEIESKILLADISNSTKEIIMKFINYSDALNNITRVKTYSVTRKSDIPANQEDSSIYHWEQFNLYFEFVNDLHYLTFQSIISQFAANAWLFILMHLTNTWRAPDIVKSLPSIDLEQLNIHSVDWFSINELSITEAQIIVNQIYLKTKNSITGKTKKKLRFYVPPTLVMPFSTAAIICELHRRTNNLTHLLSTIKSKSKNTLLPEHITSIGKHKELLEQFQSRKMNRSTLTYVYYTGIEFSGGESSNQVAQLMRSHTKQNTIEKYLNYINKDGSVNRVSINVFRRGEFGWIYNYLFIIASNNNNSQSLEERTSFIEEFRKQLTPYEADKQSKLVVNILERKESAIIRISKLSTDEITSLLIRILSGEMPSRSEGAQCLIYPNCNHPNWSSCAPCENVLPTSILLFEAVEELTIIHNRLLTTKFDVIIERDSSFFIAIYLLLHEANQAFGKGFVDAYIPREKLMKMINELTPILRLS
jgi:hypothetical protein